MNIKLGCDVRKMYADWWLTDFNQMIDSLAVEQALINDTNEFHVECEAIGCGLSGF